METCRIRPRETKTRPRKKAALRAKRQSFPPPQIQRGLQRVSAKDQTGRCSPGGLRRRRKFHGARQVAPARRCRRGCPDRLLECERARNKGSTAETREAEPRRRCSAQIARRPSTRVHG